MLNKQIPQFPDSYSSEEECEQFLFEWRWPYGFNCPCCDNESCYVINTRKLYQCKECGMQVSVTAGTIMHNSKLPLFIWFKAIDLLSQDDIKISALTLADMLGVNYRSARLMLSKIQFAIQKLYDQQLSQNQLNTDTTPSILFGVRTNDLESNSQESRLQQSNEPNFVNVNSKMKESSSLSKSSKCSIWKEKFLSQYKGGGAPGAGCCSRVPIAVNHIVTYLKGKYSQSDLLTKWMNAFTSVQLFRLFIKF
jgi:transposase-like protein